MRCIFHLAIIQWQETFLNVVPFNFVNNRLNLEFDLIEMKNVSGYLLMYHRLSECFKFTKFFILYVFVISCKLHHGNLYAMQLSLDNQFTGEKHS